MEEEEEEGVKVEATVRAKKQVLYLIPPSLLPTLTAVQLANSQTKSYLCVVTDLEESLFQVPPLNLGP